MVHHLKWSVSSSTRISHIGIGRIDLITPHFFFFFKKKVAKHVSKNDWVGARVDNSRARNKIGNQFQSVVDLLVVIRACAVQWRAVLWKAEALSAPTYPPTSVFLFISFVCYFVTTLTSLYLQLHYCSPSSLLLPSSYFIFVPCSLLTEFSREFMKKKIRRQEIN